MAEEQTKCGAACAQAAKKTLCVVTGTRAEYGLLRPVLQKLLASDAIELRLVVTGAHLSASFGNTVSEIEADGLPIHAKLDILKFGTDSAQATARTVQYALGAFLDYFTAHRPDAVLVLGDRYEIFAVGQAAALLGIPLAHISGGDVTHGAADDWFRHCLTKMASLHFPACDVYAQRVIRMGERPSTVVNVGGLGDENLRELPLLPRDALAQSLGFDLSHPYALATYHPETLGGADPVQCFDELVTALQSFDLRVIFTKANADAGGAAINARIDAICAQNKDRYVAFTSMGVLRYLSAMKYCAVVVGNSSSGVVETPSLGVPAVNIGTRQAGRLICDNVICCAPDAASIRAALAQALSPEFRTQAAHTVSPYNGGDTSGRIVRRLEQWMQSDGLCAPKIFYDGEDTRC
jgi:GDP/UDP-N,N'-diacetylbacillosamine 2-epimerase (hydrolysing)